MAFVMNHHFTNWMLKTSAAKGAAASAALHTLAAAALLSVVTLSDFDRPQFAGRSQVINLALSVEQPAVEVEQVIETPVAALPVLITPQSAELEERRLSETAASAVQFEAVSDVGEVAAAEVRPVPAEPKLVKQNTTATTAPPTQQDTPVLDRRPTNAKPQVSSVAAPPPQTLGTSERTPPSFAGNRPPHYPDMARRNGWQGTVLLLLKIDAAGQVVQVQVLESSGHQILDAEAVRAVQSWQGQPARRFGVPVPTEERLPIRFRL